MFKVLIIELVCVRRSVNTSSFNLSVKLEKVGTLWCISLVKWITSLLDLLILLCSSSAGLLFSFIQEKQL